MQALTKRFFTLRIFLQVAFTIGIACPFFLLPYLSLAQANPEINYQGKLTDTSNSAVADGTYNMRFWLLTSPSVATTSAVWTESLTSANRVQVTNGLFSVMLGSTSPLTSVDFDQTLYLGVEIGGSGGSPSWDGEMSPRKIIGTVPAAFVAREADNAALLGGVASTSFLRSDQADTASSLLTFSSGLISQASSTISNLTILTATTTNLIINGERFTDLTGTGLMNNSGVLTLDTSQLNALYASTTDFNTCTKLATILTGHTTGTCGSFVLSASPTFTGTVNAAALTLSSTLTLSGSAANIALGSNWLSGDGQDEGIYVDGSGNVGIGTSTPGVKLHVHGTAGSGNIFAISSSTGARLVTVTAAGKMGIRTSNPIADFEVVGSQMRLVNDTGTNVLNMSVGLSSASLYSTYYVGSDIPLYLGTDTNQQAITIQATTGHVGIGDTSPAALLTVGSSDAFQVNSSGRVLANFGASGAGNLAYSFVDDTNTGLYRSAADEMRFQTNGADRLSITATGNVGIGTTTPSSKLDIVGTNAAAAVSGSAANGGLRVQGGDATVMSLDLGVVGGVGGHSWIQSRSKVDYSSNLNLVLNPNGGNVGIGTTVPTQLLDVVGNSSPAIAIWDNSAAALGKGGKLLLQHTNISGARVTYAELNAYAVDGSVGNESGDLVLKTRLNGTLAEKVRIVSNGNVGIGATSPLAALTVVKDLSSGGSDATGFRLQTASGATGNLLFGGPSSAGDYSSLQSYKEGTSAGVRSLLLNPLGGNVGIGTVSPNFRLEVAGYSNAASTNKLAIGDVADYQALLYMESANETLTIENTSDYASSATIFRNNGAERMRIAVGGNVSVINLVSCGGIQTNGSGVMSCTSDERLKDVHESFTDGLASVLSIDPVVYSWKEDSDYFDNGVLYSGFLAQNVEQSVPNAVVNGAHGYKQVNTTALLATSINAIKELNLKLEDLATATSFTELAEESFTKRFFSKLIAWFANSTNGIGSLFANRVHTEELCVSNGGGAETCITKSQLDSLLQAASAGSGNSGGDGGGSYTPPTEPEVTPEPEPEPTPEPETSESSEEEAESTEDLGELEEETSPSATDTEETMSSEEDTPTEEDIESESSESEPVSVQES